MWQLGGIGGSGFSRHNGEPTAKSNNEDNVNYVKDGNIATNNNEYAIGKGSIGWWGRLMAVVAWQGPTAAMDYGKAMARGRWNSTVAVTGGDGN